MSTPPAGPNYPAPRPPNSSSKKVIWIGAFLAVLLALGFGLQIVGNIVSRDEAKSSQTRVVESPTPVPLGVLARDGTFTFVVTKVETGVPAVGGRAAKGQFVIVTVDITNTGGAAMRYLADKQKLVDTEGMQSNHDVGAEAAIASQDVVLEINPGNTLPVTIVFDIPVDADPDYLELHADDSSRGVKAALN